MSELGEKVKTSIERLRAFEPKNGEGYYLAFSGGKDSVVCKALLDMAGVKYDATYRVTSVDPPELVRFIKEKHPDVIRKIPHDKDGKPITMWSLIPKRLMPPLRRARYCCEELKEDGGDGRKTVTGVRWAESPSRRQNQGVVTVWGDAKNTEQLADDPNFLKTDKSGVVLVNDNEDSRMMVEQCYKRSKTLVNPIIDWEDRDVWDFIHSEGIPYCGLYDEGFHRLGCIGCPMGRRQGRELEFTKWPKYKAAYLLAFDKMLQKRRERHDRDPSRPVWKAYGAEIDNPTPEDVFNWWMERDVLPGQYQMDEFTEGGE